MAIHTIETRRLRLRSFQVDDWKALYDYTSDAEVMRYIPEGVFTREQAAKWAVDNQGEEARAVAVVLKGSGLLIGHMVFHPWFVTRTHEIGWVFHRAHHGCGYATEAGIALLRYGFEELRLHRIIATCQPANPASWRVMEKLGMRREGLFEKCISRPDGEWWDEYFYAILAEEWFASQRKNG